MKKKRKTRCIYDKYEKEINLLDKVKIICENKELYLKLDNYVNKLYTEVDC